MRFGPYELDRIQGLTRNGADVRLTPKSLAVLWLLADRGGRVVTKDELFETVWPDTAVTDSALATCVQEIRRALGDDARRPRFIETLHRRGYRFVAPVAAAVAAPMPPPLDREGPLIGREAEVGAVLRSLAGARSGVRQVCLITGDPGIGKSRVLSTSLAAMAKAGDVAVTWGQCVERYGSGEPFQPLLDALMRLCGSRRGAHVVETLQRYAPMWLAQLPGVLAPRDHAALLPLVAGASPDRMLRELAYAVEVMAARDVLVIAIEDLHWSDRSTLDWIATFAARTDRARVLVVATMRPPEPEDADRALQSLRETLRAKRLASEVPLAGLDAAAAATYLEARLPVSTNLAGDLQRLSAAVHEHTGGNPLFMAAVLDRLVEHGVLAAFDDGADVTPGDLVDLGVPDSVRPIIDRQVARLPPHERDLLEIGSVIGDRFSSAAVGRVAGLGGGLVDATLGTSSGRRFVRQSGTAQSPDGSASTELMFVHALYRGAIYDGISSRRRAELHLRIGDTQEGVHGDGAADLAAELAIHFELGGDTDRAIQYLQRAAENARRRSAMREARVHYERALALLGREPADKSRDERELELLIGLGAAIMATQGFGAPEAETAYAAARAVSHRIGDAPRLFEALWGQWLYYWGRGAMTTADELATELRGRATAGDRVQRLQALHAGWATAFSLGRLSDAVDQATAGIAIYDHVGHGGMSAAYGSHDAGVCARMFAARSLAFLGRTDEAGHLGDDAVELARTLKHPFSTALALTFRGAVDQSSRNARGAASYAREAELVASDHGFGLLLAWCTAIGGWADVVLGDGGGLEQIGRGIANARASGSVQFLPYLLGLHADACRHAGQIGRGLDAAEEALVLVERSGERFYESELHRLRGELLLMTAVRSPEAMGALRAALSVAREHGAALPALRSAIALLRASGGRDGDDSVEVLRVARAAMPRHARGPEIDEAEMLLRR